MLLQAFSPIFGQSLGRAGRIACTALILLVAAQASSAAVSAYPFDHETVLQTSVITSTPATAGERGDGVDETGRRRESLAEKTAFTVMGSSRSGTRATPAAETDSPSPEQATDVVVRSPDWNGIWRDTGAFFGTQIVAAGILYSMPQSVSGWSSEEKKNTFNKYSKNVLDPVFDKDQFYINYILHPYWGATYYIRGRERGLDRYSSFVYSALISAMYEFGVECFFEKPSIQDLIVTPIAGSLLGMFVFEPWRESIRRKHELHWYDHVALVVTDPLGVLSLGIEKVLGIKSSVMVEFSIPQLQRVASEPAPGSKSSRLGIVMTFPLE